MNCRKVAINILERIINEGAYSNIILSNELNNSDLSDKDKALVTEIVYGTLRRLKTIDTIIASFVKDISIMDKKILNILRVAVYQMNYLDKVPSYAACNEAVEEAKEISDKDSKLVNGILRNFVKKEGKFDIVFRNKIDEIAFDLSFEPWMVRMFIKQYGEHEALEILEGLNNTPKMTVRVNSIKGDYEDVYEELEEAGYNIEEGCICPEAISIKGGKGIENNQAFVDGKITVQDESAMLISPLLDLEEGMKVLDLCCAPGGKTTHIGELLNNTGEVLGFDLHENKLELVKENYERLGITNIKLAQMDATKLDAKLVSYADRVLLDVPCSGIGIIRKKPEIKWTKKRKDLKEIVEVQREILENAWEYLKTGGVMVYSTCTLNKEENEENIKWFLSKHKDATIEKVFIGKGANLCYDQMGTLTILPNEYMDGFFVAKIKKN
ncbi:MULTISPECIES: 16S rRNA (cytosine(967)-C(5))-methyltransferase RsmB [Clostridium]|uniref:16S rRNA (cytosine(967)-C(5))-methyltransferase RsmB n=1 Tax=Clostridium TaxID=1485 RepID=UPI00066791F6|nr:MULTISPECIES: 16S rRNA (cytosine(967)-C(5))-methyltransferase RsmB [Clostridium]MBS7129668.1 16S rRNA (cytosine(967)-C(5))-methyltransferase RsmB [Clostridium sp.]MDB2086434.1 16S rRNA (cytosine(967)-C(5))-methyltransferase RsmB [Clostridium paraputrificum]MDB2092158.1 16S rRNA (cytosine(967)-C(5))-methyltransferase RsmB [Clostridium paraputrificum]MDB2107005.1 16S rRNA (cytosine(967)-C(5))-methyltransferase RsmB [Clostridium paraputrificum]MDB2113060.1 16S rRNA (cytosine(967)-C(5))-methylt